MMRPVSTLQLDATCQEDIEHATALLRAKALVALPTETVYGLAANAFCPQSIKKIYDAKNRPHDNPLIVHTHSMSAARLLFGALDQRTEKRLSLLADALWPGPLTIIAPKASHIPHEVSGGLETVAVRVPQQKTCLAILKALDFPLVMPSANLSTRPSPTKKEHVLKTLDGRIDAVLDDGPCGVGIESTVVRIDQENVMILRLGHVSKENIALVLKEKVQIAQAPKKAPLCPGQSYLHYAPSVKKVLLANEEQLGQAWHTCATILTTKTVCATLALTNGDRKEGLTLALSDCPEVFALELYDALYASENRPEQALFITVPQSESWNAVNDRLCRSAGFKQP